MIYLVLAIAAFAGFYCQTLYWNKKNPTHTEDEITDEDCYHANRLRMGILEYKKFSKIYEELQTYILENGSIPEVTELPKTILKNFGRWKAFCQYKEFAVEDAAHKKRWMLRHQIFKVTQPILLFALFSVLIYWIFSWF